MCYTSLTIKAICIYFPEKIYIILRVIKMKIILPIIR